LCKKYLVEITYSTYLKIADKAETRKLTTKPSFTRFIGFIGFLPHNYCIEKSSVQVCISQSVFITVNAHKTDFCEIQVLMAVSMKVTDFWDIAPRRLIEIDQQQ